MALGDKFVWDVVRKAVLLSLDDVDTILYRQEILKDCVKNAAIVRDLYAIAVEAIERERKVWRMSSPDSLHTSSCSNRWKCWRCW